MSWRVNHNDQFMSRFILWSVRGIFLGGLCLIIWKSLETTSSTQIIVHFDKFLHFGAYAVLCFAALLARLFKRPIMAVLLVIAIGLSLEILQGVMGIGRTASFADFAANSCGAIMSFLVWRRFKIS